MILPQHQNPIEREERAKAPYNFVPLPETVVSVEAADLPDQDCYAAERLTGTIHCSLTTRSPLYIRAALEENEYGRDSRKQDANKHKSDFFYVDPASRQPVIPGSSLHGMLRTLVEIASFGKMEYVTDRPLVYRSIGDTTDHGTRYRSRLMHSDGKGYNSKGKQVDQYTGLMQAGYMHRTRNGAWEIRPAQQRGGVSFARIHKDRLDKLSSRLARIEGCRNARTIYIQPGPYEYQEVRGGFLKICYSKVIRASAEPGAGLLPSAVARSGAMASKRYETVIFPEDANADAIAISQKLVELYQEQISQEQEKLLGRDGVLNEGQPVFYLIENGQLVFFSHTMMMRLPYLQNPLDFVPKKLRITEMVDLPEALFGYTKKEGKGKEQAYASRVSIGNATLEPNQTAIWLRDEPIVPKILASPKPTAFQHYLVQVEPNSQEVSRTRDGRAKKQKSLADYTASTSELTVLRGHKLYWHKGQTSVGDIEETPEKREKMGDKDTQHTQFRPVAAGVQFSFDIHFENLSEVELGALLWILSLPGQPDKEYCHKLGMGKPLGMGAIQIAPTLYLDQRSERYTQLFSGEGWHTSRSLASDIEPYLLEYENCLLQNMDRFERSTAQRLGDTYRIQTLLRLLEWPGPDGEETRYLEIERKHPTLKRGKVNEYKERPVLPLPLDEGRPDIDRDTFRKSAPAESTAQVYSSEVDTPAKGESAVAKALAERLGLQGNADAVEGETAQAHEESMVELAKPTSAEEIEIGMHLEGIVVRVESSRIVVDLQVDGVGESSLLKERIHPSTNSLDEIEERFASGEKIKVWVRSRNKRGRIQLTMEKQK